MKKALRIVMALVMVIGLVGVCGSVTSCKSSNETMYSSKKLTCISVSFSTVIAPPCPSVNEPLKTSMLADMEAFGVINVMSSVPSP